MAPLQFGYWSVRGLGQAIRLLLEYSGEKYEEKRFEKDELLVITPPQLPYLIDGDVRISQSSVILRYLGEKHSLGGKSAKEQAEIAMAEAAIKDLRNGLSRIAYSPKYKEERPSFMPTFEKGIEDISNYLGEKKWLMGDNITYADFFLYENLCVFHVFEPSCFDKYPNLKQYIERFEALPKIKEYMASERFISWPLNGWSASFGGGDAPPNQSL
ncbi:Glutathione S-transferase, mu [Sparganum proliferum]